MTWNFKPPDSTSKSNNGKHGGFRKYNSLNNLPAIRIPNWIYTREYYFLFQGDIDSNAGGVYDRCSDSFSGSNADAHLWAEDSDLERWDIHVTSLTGHVTSMTGHVTLFSAGYGQFSVTGWSYSKRRTESEWRPESLSNWRWQVFSLTVVLVAWISLNKPSIVH